MKTLFALLFCFTLTLGFCQSTDVTFSVKKNNAPMPAGPDIPSESILAKKTFTAINDSTKLIWWKTQLTGDDTISLKTLRLGYSISLKHGDYGTQIISFAMDFIRTDKTVKLSSNRSYLTQAMAMELSNTKPGTTIVIKKMTYNRWQRTFDKSGSFAIETTDPNTPVQTLSTGPFKVFVTE